MLLGAILLGILAACSPAAEPGPWRRVDLWLELPRFEDAAGRRTSFKPRRVEVPQGASEVRNLALLTPWQKKTRPKLSAGQVRALWQQAGSLLVTSLELGAEPFFSFIPLDNEAAPCPCEFAVSARLPGGAIQRLETLPMPDGMAPPPTTHTVDLGEFAGQRVDLLLSVLGPSNREALWGSPAVYSRGSALPEPVAGTVVDSTVIDSTVADTVAEGKPNIILLGIDTLRADALGTYGQSPSRTPAIDRLAMESDLWLNAYTTFNVTVPSFTSILSGLYGKHHGIYDNRTKLPSEVPTLAGSLGKEGYVSAAILAAQHLQLAGLGRDFDVVTSPQGYFRGETPIDQAISWISLQEKPFFCWLHLYDPHTPHTPPGRFAQGYGPDGLFGLGPVGEWKAFRQPGPRSYAHQPLAGDSELYAAEVAYVDRQVDRLMDFLRSRDLLRNSIVVLVADHGENLEEHGILYTHTGLWDTTTRVPLMVRWPGRKRQGQRLEGLVQTLDLFPTLLAAVGAPPVPGDGRDLRELQQAGGRPVVFAEHAHGRGEMVRSRHFKYLTSRDNPQIEAGAYLYDLRRDPEELENLAGRGLGEESRLAKILATWRATKIDQNAEAVDLDREAEEQLRALGYLGGG
jgi:arylsulfatase A-like enzyme